MTYNELRKRVNAIYGTQGVDVAIHQSELQIHDKVCTHIVVSSYTDFHKYTYLNKTLFCVSGSDLTNRIIKQMKNIMEDEE